MRLMVLGLMMNLGLANYALAQDEIKSARAAVSTVYQRLASVPPSRENIQTWAQQYVDAKDRTAKRAVLLNVANQAVQRDSFYSRTVLNFADRETNDDGNLNNQENRLTDYTATIVGFVRDELDYRQILSADLIYVPSAEANVGAYDPAGNDAYEDLIDLVLTGERELSGSLTQTPQTGTTGLPVQAGIFTTRFYGSKYYFDGTNRAAIQSIFLNYACRELEQLSDTTRPDVFVRRDVERTPGGDGEAYRTECVGCHAGMDAMTGAFAYIDWNDNAAMVTYNSDRPVPKVNRNSDVFPNGHEVRSDEWSNPWLQGSNANLGWNKDMSSGNGIASWGQSMATTSMFPECMAERVYKTVCFKSAMTNRDRGNVSTLARQFREGGFNMKELFVNATVQCVDGLSL